tara:strand:+ start:834 stop:1097 length:264 start_codon:yes stop_codon:yes gene_type:complete
MKDQLGQVIEVGHTVLHCKSSRYAGGSKRKVTGFSRSGKSVMLESEWRPEENRPSPVDPLNVIVLDLILDYMKHDPTGKLPDNLDTL